MPDDSGRTLISSSSSFTFSSVLRTRWLAVSVSVFRPADGGGGGRGLPGLRARENRGEISLKVCSNWNRLWEQDLFR